MNSGITYVADPKDEKPSIIKSFKNFLNKIHSTWEDSYYFNLNPDSFSFDSDRSIINEFVQADFIFDCSGLKCKLDRDTWLIYCTSNSKVFFMELSSLLSIKKNTADDLERNLSFKEALATIIGSLDERYYVCVIVYPIVQYLPRTNIGMVQLLSQNYFLRLILIIVFALFILIRMLKSRTRNNLLPTFKDHKVGSKNV